MFCGQKVKTQKANRQTLKMVQIRVPDSVTIRTLARAQNPHDMRNLIRKALYFVRGRCSVCGQWRRLEMRSDGLTPPRCWGKQRFSNRYSRTEFWRQEDIQSSALLTNQEII
jgi:hypothetical protein